MQTRTPIFKYSVSALCQQCEDSAVKFVIVRAAGQLAHEFYSVSYFGYFKIRSIQFNLELIETFYVTLKLCCDILQLF